MVASSSSSRQQPTGGDPWVPARLFAGDQERQLERVGEPEPGEFLGCRLGAHQVAALERSPEDRVGMALGGRRCSSPGPSGTADPKQFAPCGYPLAGMETGEALKEFRRA
jgi:hypothetical protein